MNAYDTCTCFLKRFRLEDVQYTLSEEIVASDFCFKQFAGNGRELRRFAKLLSGRLATNAIVESIRDGLVNSGKDLVHLSTRTRKVTKRIAAEMKNDPGASYHYSQLGVVLCSLAALVTAFQRNVHQHMLELLFTSMDPNINPDDKPVFTSEDVYTMQIVMQKYKEEICANFNDCWFYLHKEIDECRGTRTVSKVEHWLIDLLNNFDKCIYNIELLQVRLENWKYKLTLAERQEVWN